MHDLLKAICDELDVVSQKVGEISTEERTFAVTTAWHLPAVSYRQLSYLPFDIARAIRGASLDELNEDETDQCKDVLASLKDVREQMLPNFSSSPSAAVQGFIGTMSYIEITVAPMLGWRSADSNRLPNQLVRRMNKISREIDQMAPDKEALAMHIQTLLAAREAADRLPTDMQELRATQAEVRQIATNSAEFSGRIQENLKGAVAARELLDEMSLEAASLVKQATETYGLTTSIALASSFDDRARKLSKSVTVWVSVLAATLTLILVIAWLRLSAMQHLFSQPTFDAPRIWIQLAISAFSVGAPIWFAWISTKQIAQRFRLAEDYSFKASVATAYEGYRREARRVDPEFEKALFASALARLDEAPLRLMELKTPGSPLHEMAESSAAKTILKSLANRISSSAKTA
ncbi:hypothetical protein GR198_20495 [Rhizobium leguminosarum]|uniref:hypothetical protein n=1 Tax=Rhizobium leguminosarum TaxID=384 RepID=UPI0013BEDC62|nr:hypothetical protein [Rhizobium leguminosarum]NEH58108.1 hypothetical protein [Rhizobium leguminosarum]